jgi:hypothetical protein
VVTESDEDPLDTAPASPEPIVEWQRNTRAGRSQIALGLGAAGAFAFGALAIGAVTIGAVAIGRLRIGKVRLGVLVIDRLIVRAQGEAN